MGESLETVLLQSTLTENVWIVLTLFIFVWIFSWAKGSLGSAKLAVLFAIIIVFLTFYQFPLLIWMAVIIYIAATFGRELFKKLNPWEGGDQRR